jgi:hypothetical protein
MRPVVRWLLAVTAAASVTILLLHYDQIQRRIDAARHDFEDTLDTLGGYALSFTMHAWG